jgi:hypothetical protein
MADASGNGGVAIGANQDWDEIHTAMGTGARRADSTRGLKPNMSTLTSGQLVAHDLVCPAGGVTMCDNGGECGLCLLGVPQSLKSQCPYGRTLPYCRPGKVGFGQFCEASGGTGHLTLADGTDEQFLCGTSKHINSCFGGFDTYVNVFCEGVSPQKPPPPPLPPSPLPMMPPPPLRPPPPLSPPLPGGPPPPDVSVDTAALSDSHILVAAAIPAGSFGLFCMVLLVYCALRRRSSARVTAEHRSYQAKLETISNEYNASVLFAVKSMVTADYASAQGVEMSSGARGRISDECSVCMEAFKESDRLKVLPCHHAVRWPQGWPCAPCFCSHCTPARPPAHCRGSSTSPASTSGCLERAACHLRRRRPYRGCQPAPCARRCRSKSHSQPCLQRHAFRSRGPRAVSHLQRQHVRFSPTHCTFFTLEDEDWSSPYAV